MTRKAPQKSSRISGKRKIFYNLTAGIIIPLLLLLIVEFVLRLSGYGESYRLFIEHPYENYEGYLIVNPKIGGKYFHQVEYTPPPNDIFLKKKEPDTFRVFVMGSSTVVGFPYGFNLMFGRILHHRLQEAYPGKNIEVIHTAITAVNSYTLLDFTDQILKHDPDAVLIYAGHNEFYGAMGVGSLENSGRSPGLIRLHLRMMNSRLYQLLQNIIHSLAGPFSKDEKTVGPLMKRIVKKNTILYGSEDYRAGIHQFRDNMDRIIHRFTRKGVHVYLSHLVSNVRDLEPFESVKTENYPAASEIYDRAREADRTGDFEKAKSLYNYARDLDCVRFRASGEINTIITELADNAEVTLIPMLRIFEQHSPQGIVGDHLLTEHVHPNFKGYFLMADAFFKALVQEKQIAPEPDIYSTHSAEYHQRTWGFTLLDTLVARHWITNLSYHWPFRPADAPFRDYRQIYQPVSYVDSVAFSVITSDKAFGVDDAHSKVADYYEKEGDIVKAFQEADALVRMNPYLAPYYRKAADYLLKLNDLPRALVYFKQSLKYEDTFYAHFRVGELYLILNNMENAILHLEQAEKLSESNTLPNVQYKLYVAHSYAGHKEKAQKMADRLKQVDPEADLRLPARANLLMRYIPARIQDLYDQAKELLDAGKPEHALTILYRAAGINDSPIVNRRIAEINHDLKNTEAADFHFKKCYPYFKTDPPFLHDYFLFNMTTGDTETAQKCLEEIKGIAPDYPALNALESILKKHNQLTPPEQL